jgi:mRNA interferase RelE/StbE
MTYTVELTNLADKQFQRLNEKQQDRINEALINLCEFCERKTNKKPYFKALSGKYTGLLRMRVGEYRIIFSMNAAKFIILVIQIVPRGKAYK